MGVGGDGYCVATRGCVGVMSPFPSEDVRDAPHTPVMKQYRTTLVGLNSGSDCPHGEVSLGKTLNPNLLPVRQAGW